MLRYKTNTIELAENGIVYFRSEADDLYTDQDLIQILELVEKEAGNKPFLLLMVVNGHEFLMTKEARNLFSTYEKAFKLIKAEAVILQSVPSKILYNLLTRIHSPKFPFKAFTDEERAVKWLLKHK
ncbi:hypothetical protein OAE48_01090 [Flavobacteriales bacterium]|nr:hypothetical protein [Flavobacteriales bacterium]